MKIQATIDFQGKLEKSQKAIIQYNPYKRREMYFVSRTGKSYVVSPKNKRMLYLAGDLDLQGELFINNRFVKDTPRNRSKLNRSNKIKNPLTNRWIKDTPLNRKKVLKSQANDLSKQIREYKAAKAIKNFFLKKFLKSMKPYLIETTYKLYYRYTVPKFVLARSEFVDIENPKAYPDIVMASYVYNLFKDIMKEQLKKFKFCKYWISYTLMIDESKIKQEKSHDDRPVKEKIWNVYHNKASRSTNVGTMNEFWYTLYYEFYRTIEEILGFDYGIPVRFVKIDLHVYKFNPLKGGTYVPLPRAISATKGVVNVQNKDNLCFLYSILAIKHRAKKDPQRVKQYKKYLNELKYDESDFPMSLARIRFFEKKNNIGINVYGCEETKNDEAKEEPFYVDQEVEANEEELEKYKDDADRLKRDIEFHEQRIEELLNSNELTVKINIQGLEIERDRFDEICKYREKIVMNKEKIEMYNNLNTTSIKIKRFPLRLSTGNYNETYNLLLYNGHYSAITNFNRYAGVGESHQHVCPNCLGKYSNDKTYENHKILCSQLNDKGSFVTMPSENEAFEKFRDHKKAHPIPVVLYADTESILDKTNVNSITTGSTEVICNHRAVSFRINVCSSVDLHGIKLDYDYVSLDTPKKFMETIHKLDTQITATLNSLKAENKKHKLTEEEEEEFKRATKCCFCNKPLLTYYKYNKICEENSLLGEAIKGELKVRDHDHYTGKYFGAAHSACNTKVKDVYNNIPCFFHNSNYDIKQLLQAYEELKGSFFKNVSCIAKNTENFKCIRFGNIIIQDSYAHLKSSLDSLVKSIPAEKKTMLRTISGDDEEKFNLICMKGIFPYEYFDSIEKLDIQLKHNITVDDFYSHLNLKELTKEELKHIKKVVKVFNIKTLREYHDLYLKIDVYGLRDVFEYHREITRKMYGLDPAHFIGLPALTWAAGFRYTQETIDLMTDQEMYLMSEKQIVGGISTISHKYAKANNPYLPDYNETEETSYLFQGDVNNLYGWAMSQKLPCGDFKWEEPELPKNYDPEGDRGYVLEVDLEYPDHLHDLHNDYPLAPEKLMINKVVKLAPNLNNKTHYVESIDNLLYYISKGLILTKVHRVFSFKRRAWLKPYIDFNTEQRQKAKNDFEKAYFKDMNNSFYGKNLQNVRGYTDIRFCINEKQFNKWMSSPLLAGPPIIIKEDGLALVQTNKKTVVLNRPIFIGACILSNSKLLMYKIHYDAIKKVYPDAKMLKTDTDSLLYHINTKDLYHDMKVNPILQQHFEFSNYPKNHDLYNDDRKKKVGILQDECVDGKFVIISEYVGLRAKCYSSKLYDPGNKCFTDDKKKCKGVKTCHVKKVLKFEDFKNCLFNNKAHYVENIHSFRSRNLHIQTICQKKKALDRNDDKRILIPGTFATYAIGHYATKK